MLYINDKSMSSKNFYKIRKKYKNMGIFNID